MKKKRVAKIITGVAAAALCVTGAVNYLAYNNAATIIDTAEIGTYAAGTNDKDWEAANDSFAAAGEAVKQAAEDAAAEKAAEAESADETETAQAAQTAQGTQSAQPETQPTPTPAPVPAPVTTPVASPQPTQSAEPDPTPTPEYCGHCGAVFYSESEVIAHILAEHSASTPAPTPAPAPQPQTTAYVCGYCGAKFYNESESSAHLLTHKTPPADVYVCDCGFKGTKAEVWAHQDAMDAAGTTAGHEGYHYGGQ